MQKMLQALTVLACMLLFVSASAAAKEWDAGALPARRVAVGNQNDYTSGGSYSDSDSSSGSWSSGYSDDEEDDDYSVGSAYNSSGSSETSDSWTWDRDDDDAYSNKSSSSGSGSAGSRKSSGTSSARNTRSTKSSKASEDSGGAGTVILVIFGAVFLIVLISIASNSVSMGRGSSYTPPKRRDTGVQRPQKPRPPSGSWPPVQPVARPAVNQLMELKKTDPDFSEPAFLAWAREVFIQLNTAWTKQDWAMIRPFESDSLFREHSMQLEEYKRNGTVNYLERVAVKDSFIERYFKDAQYEYLVVKLRTSMIDYVMETATGKITAGDRTTLWQMLHTLTFMRTLGVKTQAAENGLHADNCPNCGAPVSLNTAGVCEYCKSPISSGQFDWVLCKFSGTNL